MTDVVDRATRSRMMSGIRGRDTKPEIIVRKFLHAQGFRYRVAPKKLPGKPDVVLPKYRVAIFVHGCFWHRHRNCKFATIPASNAAFWQSKFEENIARDKHVLARLRRLGWRVFTVWSCSITEPKMRTLARRIRGGS